MDFEITLQEVISRFDRAGIGCAVIGGFALGLLGVGRPTVDLDLLVRRDDLATIDPILTGLGYELRFRSENVSQFQSALAVFGELDLLHAFRPLSLAMLRRAVPQEVFSAGLRVPVLEPVDLIGLKLQALKNDPAGRPRDRFDILQLLRRFGGTLDRDLLEEYAMVLGMEEFLVELRQETTC